jgi:hypothetical protein
MLKQAVVLACSVMGIATAGLFAAQAEVRSPAPSQAVDYSRPIAGIQLAQQKSCKEICHEQFQNCTPASSKNLDACRATWQACDAKCPQ